ncbi:hypothetical protein ACIQTT_10485 [Microbacterium sp. NPDC090225]|uniref:hypothetical protein n=1 Tax=Microbacterium sp. NPDC090225 TaxID=3364207 RepID=UPI0037F92D44
MLHSDRLGVVEPDQWNLPADVDKLARHVFNTDPENIFYGRDYDDAHPRNSMQAEYRERAILHAMALLALSAPLPCTQTQEDADEYGGEGRDGVR